MKYRAKATWSLRDILTLYVNEQPTIIKDSNEMYLEVDDETEAEYIENIERLEKEYRRELLNLLHYLVEVKRK